MGSKKVLRPMKKSNKDLRGQIADLKSLIVSQSISISIILARDIKPLKQKTLALEQKNLDLIKENTLLRNLHQYTNTEANEEEFFSTKLCVPKEIKVTPILYTNGKPIFFIKGKN